MPDLSALTCELGWDSPSRVGVDLTLPFGEAERRLDGFQARMMSNAVSEKRRAIARVGFLMISKLKARCRVVLKTSVNLGLLSIASR